MNLFKPKHLLLLLSLYVPLCHADDAPMAGTPFDLQGYIDGELKVGKKRIVIPPGRYRVTPHKRTHLRLENLENIEIIAKRENGDIVFQKVVVK